MNSPAAVGSGGRGIRPRKPSTPKTKNTRPSRYRTLWAAIFMIRFLSFARTSLWQRILFQKKRSRGSVARRFSGRRAGLDEQTVQLRQFFLGKMPEQVVVQFPYGPIEQSD